MNLLSLIGGMFANVLKRAIFFGGFYKLELHSNPGQPEVNFETISNKLRKTE